MDVKHPFGLLRTVSRFACKKCAVELEASGRAAIVAWFDKM